MYKYLNININIYVRTYTQLIKSNPIHLKMFQSHEKTMEALVTLGWLPVLILARTPCADAMAR